MTRTGIFLLALLLPLLSVHGCSQPDRGFRFVGRYDATGSGYHIHVISKGFVKAGDDIAETAFAVVVFCPDSSPRAKPLRIMLTSRPMEWIKLDCEELGIVSADLNRRSSRDLWTKLLTQSGYETLLPDEVEGSVKVIMNSLAGPKGIIMKGQIKSLQVVETTITHGYDLRTDDPPATWIGPMEYPSCDGH